MSSPPCPWMSTTTTLAPATTAITTRAKTTTLPKPKRQIDRSSIPGPAAVPITCCFAFIDFPIPYNKIVSALRTSPRCATKAIVVTTPRTQFCVKPNEVWIKAVMKKQLQK
uniref:Chemokine CCL-CUe n=1 Tax=Danio rerio TaxID=7955 RepID=A9ZPG3_DANRE|nr:chemokine CCL-CUe [Danio rerio]|eukprot:NP_001121750.1 uncharacterized protein LOC100000741 [Danio rerio]